MASAFGWAGSGQALLDVEEDAWLEALSEHMEALHGHRPSGMQVDAWRAEFDVMRGAIQEAAASNSKALDWGVVFEYELPMEGGRRPDVVVLAGGAVVVLEFKTRLAHYTAHFDQVDAYARDLNDYHSATHGRSVVPVLVMYREGPTSGKRLDTYFTDGAGVGRILLEVADGDEIDLQEWLEATYAPLPTLVAAARTIFEHEPLPQIRQAESAGIPQALNVISERVERTRSARSRALVLVTGVPGSGKTLVGLQTVYQLSSTEGDATFLSGNGPLVRVLQDALKSRVFVRDLHSFVRQYGIQEKVPRQHIIVFDEAQRAWDKQYMRLKKNIERSEPQLLVDAAERVEDWTVLVGLVGEGQEIHSGEEGGLGQWAEAIGTAKDQWTVYCPPRLKDVFRGVTTETHSVLDLTISLRSRRAEQLHRWVELLLEGSPDLAAQQSVRVQREETYPMYLTRDLDAARTFLRARYEGEEEKRFGLLASSHAKNLDKHGVDRHFLTMRKMKEARWFNAPPDDPMSSCALDMPATEFQCQGLELDMPLVAWGSDYFWTEGAWKINPIRRQFPLEDPRQILRNTYRVLLTRGRDGLVVFVPPAKEADATAGMLLAAGLEPLPSPEVIPTLDRAANGD